MDALDQMIQTEVQELARLHNAVNAQKIKVDALMAAATARPAARPVQEARPPVKSSGGKPKGAISSLWRKILKAAYQSGKAQSYQEMRAIYEKEHGSAPDLSSIRDRMRNFIEWGFVEGTPDTGFTVTEVAAKKFSFERPEQASEGNGPHGSDASEPSARGWGVSPPQPSIFGNPQSGPDS